MSKRKPVFQCGLLESLPPCWRCDRPSGHKGEHRFTTWETARRCEKPFVPPTRARR
jgi:hypothetical protein